MPWKFSAIGNAGAVARKLSLELREAGTHHEQSLKTQVSALVSRVLCEQPETDVLVEISGDGNPNDVGDRFAHALSIRVEPVDIIR